MKRNKYKSPAYWTQLIQLSLFENIKRYLEDKGLSRTDFANQLGVSKGYVSQIMNGDFDHKLSKLTELALACEMVPRVEFVPLRYADMVANDAYLVPVDWSEIKGYRQTYRYTSIPQAVAASGLSEVAGKSYRMDIGLGKESFPNSDVMTSLNRIA